MSKAEQILSIDWESEEAIKQLADSVEAESPSSDEIRKLTLARILIKENVPADLVPNINKKVLAELKRRKDEFYNSVGGKEAFESGARRNAYKNELLDD